MLSEADPVNDVVDDAPPPPLCLALFILDHRSTLPNNHLLPIRKLFTPRTNRFIHSL